MRCQHPQRAARGLLTVSSHSIHQMSLPSRQEDVDG